MSATNADFRCSANTPFESFFRELESRVSMPNCIEIGTVSADIRSIGFFPLSVFATLRTEVEAGVGRRGRVRVSGLHFLEL